MVAGSLAAAPIQLIQVKNTFVDFVCESEGVECGLNSAARAQRQYSAPAGYSFRQYSAPSNGSQPKLQGVDEDFGDEDFGDLECGSGRSPIPLSASEQDAAIEETEMLAVGDSLQRQVTEAHWPSYSCGGGTSDLVGGSSGEVSPEESEKKQASKHMQGVNYGPYSASSPFMVVLPYVQQGSAAQMGGASMPYAAAEFVDAAGTTMLMLCNLPEQYTQTMLLEEINNEGFMGSYDFLHLPFDRETGTNCGYALVNFVDVGHAHVFAKVFEGRKMSRFDSDKTVSVIAVRQGSEAQSVHSSARGSQGTRRGGRRRRGGSLIDRAVKQQQLAEQQTPKPPADSGAASAAVAADGPATVLPAAGSAGDTPPVAPAVVGGAAAAAGSGGSMRFCPYCGGKRHAAFKFCQFCGQSLNLDGSSSEGEKA